MHPNYGTVLNEDDVGVFIGESHKVRAGGTGHKYVFVVYQATQLRRPLWFPFLRLTTHLS